MSDKPMMTLAQVAQWTGGQLQGADRPIAALSTDSRALSADSLFVALSGDNFDAHDFLPQAKAAGACAALVSQPQECFADAVTVADTREGLGRLASGYASQFPVPRVAVTGNAGKTTVKEMIAALLGEQTLATRGNFNNDIGVPLSLLRLNSSHHYAVLELGANAPGEIAWTSSLVRPDVALITNVTGAHLEGFGTMQGIANAKAEIFSGCVAGGRAVINGDDSFADFFTREAEKAGLQVLTISRLQTADLYATDIAQAELSLAFTLQPLGLRVELPLPGIHQVSNALMACAAVQALGLSLAECLPRLQQLQPVPGRMNAQPLGAGLLVDDSYNANPGSVRAAIEWLAARPAPRCLVLGALGELGPQAEQIMTELGADAAAAGIEQLLTLPGAEASARGFGAQARKVADYQQAAELAGQVLDAAGTVLVKGSRSAGMDAVVRLLNNKGDSPQQGRAN